VSEEKFDEVISRSRSVLCERARKKDANSATLNVIEKPHYGMAMIQCA